MNILKPLGKVLRGWKGRSSARNQDHSPTPAPSKDHTAGSTTATPSHHQPAPRAKPTVPFERQVHGATATTGVGAARPAEPVHASTPEPAPESLVLATEDVDREPPVEPRPAGIPLTDLTDTTFPVTRRGFPSPPGVGRDERPLEESRLWVRRTSFLRPALLAEALQGLESGRTHLERVAVEEPLGVLWPRAVDPATRGEFRVPKPDARYLIAQGTRRGDPRTLDLALPGSGDDAMSQADDFDRLELVRLVAMTLDVLHSADVVTAGLEWGTFLFTLEPRPSVLLNSPGKLRRMGGEFLISDSENHGSLDADRSAFAVLAYRLLVSHDLTSPLDWTPQGGIAGLSAAQDERVWQLWERSAGPEGTRPRIAEWWPALGDTKELSVLGATGGR